LSVRFKRKDFSVMLKPIQPRCSGCDDVHPYRAFAAARGSPICILETVAAHHWISSAATKAGMELEPGFTITRFRAGRAARRVLLYLSGRERIYEGMRRAGIPD
jgi:hypothetical protein